MALWLKRLLNELRSIPQAFALRSRSAGTRQKTKYRLQIRLFRKLKNPLEFESVWSMAKSQIV